LPFFGGRGIKIIERNIKYMSDYKEEILTFTVNKKKVKVFH